MLIFPSCVIRKRRESFFLLPRGVMDEWRPCTLGNLFINPSYSMHMYCMEDGANLPRPSSYSECRTRGEGTFVSKRFTAHKHPLNMDFSRERPRTEFGNYRVKCETSRCKMQHMNSRCQEKYVTTDIDLCHDEKLNDII